MNLPARVSLFAVVALAVPAAVAALTTACGSAQPPDVPPVGSIPYLPLPPPPRHSMGMHSTPPPAPTAAATTPPVATGAPRPLTTAEIAALLASPDRTDDDRKLDPQRKPDKLLAFLGIGPGMRAGEIGAGRGYTTELLARAVGPTGKVYAENPPDLVKKFLEAAWSARLARPANANVVREDQPFDAPFTPDVTGLDLVVNVLFYHDTVWIGADRGKMNAAVFAALRSGGAYVIVDHSAKPGEGTKVAKTTHRIEESVVTSEVEKAGFKLDTSADFLKNPADTRDWNDAPMAAGDKRGTSDRFVLRFVKP